MKIDGANESHHEALLGKSFSGGTYALDYPERSTMKLDNNGVLLFKIPYTDEFDYYPIHMAQYGLGNLGMYLDTGDSRYKETFFNQVNWLYQNLVIGEGYGIWEHYYKLPYYDFNKIPWVHGLGQGLGMTALLKAYQLTGNDVYLTASDKIYQSFEVDIADGGVRFVDGEGNVWLEEYALLPPPHVLNGFITILFSIYEFYHVTDKDRAMDLWDAGIKTLKENLAKYDIGYWSLYNLIHKMPSPTNYHAMHVRQLRILYDLTGEKKFREYAYRWETYLNRWANRNRATFNRGVSHLERYGTRECLRRYFQLRKWKEDKKRD